MVDTPTSLAPDRTNAHAAGLSAGPSLAPAVALPPDAHPLAAGVSFSRREPGLKPLSVAMRSLLFRQLEAREAVLLRALETAHSLSIIIDRRERVVRDRRHSARSFQQRLLDSDRGLQRAAIVEAAAAMKIVETMRKMLGLPPYPACALPTER
jgi:hypothetical protein